MSFYTSLTGLNSATKQLAVTSNNIANVGTSGFKRSRADFGDIFSTSPLQKSSAAIGQGVSLKQVSQEFSQGNVSTSGNSLDLAITGDGFFPLKSPDGLQDIYTRNGSFTLNDQNNVVNSAGQRLQAASVDSSGKADLSSLSALTIPPKTSGEAQETQSISLGLNLPANSTVITDSFDRTDPTTYNKSTALTVYDAGGNGYLATVYYVKTQNASQASPQSKWQTYFYIGDTRVRPELLQAANETGAKFYVNKYGTIASSDDVNADGAKVVTPPSGKTEMYTLDQLTDVRAATPATANTASLTLESDGTFATVPDVVCFAINVDGQSSDQVIRLNTLGSAFDFSDPTVMARQMEVAINNALGADELDTRAYDSSGNLLSGVDDRRFGVKVAYDATAGQFSISSGTTGDQSAIKVGAATFGSDAFQPELTGAELSLFPSISMDVAVDGGASVSVAFTPMAADSVPSAMASKLQSQINAALVATGSTKSVKVTWDSTNAKFTIASSNSSGSIAVSNQDADATRIFNFSSAGASTASISATEIQLADSFGFEIALNDASGGALLGTSVVAISFAPSADDADPVQMAATLESLINVQLNAEGVDAKVAVAYDKLSNAFTYGLTSSVNADDVFEIKPAGTEAGTVTAGGTLLDAVFNLTSETSSAAATTTSLLALTGSGASLVIDTVSGTPERGESSEPAVLTGATMTMNTTKDVSVGSTNNKFYVNVGGIGGNITLTAPRSYSMTDLCSELEAAINGGTGPSLATYGGLVNDYGRKVSGVTVSFDEGLKQLSFTTATMGDEASIQVSGSADWGLDATEIQFGSTSSWTKLAQYTENGAAQYVKNGVQTEDSADLSTNTEWWPVYLDRGELSFDLTGKPVSPLSQMGYETAFLDGGKGALTLAIDFTSSTQYSSPFAVLSQSQDGAPEGELMGLDIGVDGLVSATYSNGSQNSLGKIVLANFSSPTGLRQVGDASYLASASSGSAEIGEAGSAGYGSIRAGATERSNVDLTQELVDLITAQRNFQANSKAIETSSTMTSAIINLRS